MVFFVIEIKTRAVEIAGIEVDPDGEWMKQMARNLTDPMDGFLRHAMYLVHDRDPLFVEGFTAILRERGVESVKIPAQSPNCNSYAERFVKTIKHECLNEFVIFGERHLRYLIKEFVEHHHAERFHQGLGGKLIEEPTGAATDAGSKGKVVCRSRIGGMLNFYHREAA
jgi:putative transposase